MTSLLDSAQPPLKLMTRSLYRHDDLTRLLSPRSVAVVGASPRQGSFAQRTVEYLASFSGEVYLVNPKYEVIGTAKVYPSVRALPATPDCVVIALPREAVEPAVMECVDAGVGGIVIYASGYVETGLDERRALQERLSTLARDSGVRILGPNCMGFANFATDMNLSFVQYSRPETPRHACIGVASQSGAMSNSLGEAARLGVSFSHTLSAGNSCDVDVADLVAYLAEEPECKAIACVFEGMSDPKRFFDAADLAWAKGKPLVVYKMANGVEGSRAAASHTGMLAGAREAYAAAFARSGVIVVPTLEDVIETAAFFAKAPAPLSEGVAVVSTSGGAAIMAADAAEIHAVPMPQPAAPAQLVMDERVPDFGSSRNPFDLTAALISNPQALRECVQALMADPHYGVVVMAQPQAYAAAVPRIGILSEQAVEHGKMACNMLVSQWLTGPGALESERDNRVALFRSVDRCFSALNAWHIRARRMAQRAGESKPIRKSPANALQETAELLGSAHTTLITERLGKRILATYGIPTVLESLVSSADEAAAAAARMGFPVVLKVDSPDIAHKTEAGVVRLGIANEAELRQGHADVLERARETGPTVRIEGVLVQSMIPAGLEMVVGARIDPQFGPLLLVGMGGILVELLGDTVTALAPVTHAEALDMLQRLRGSALLDGYRGSAPVDRNRLADIVCRVSELAADHADRIKEIDINPLICFGADIVAVDALLVLEAR
jgi:acyl-CoA synthetase (NDP forming)